MKFRQTKKLHFIGIGGSGMSGIAEILINMGYEVTGSDMAESDTTPIMVRSLNWVLPIPLNATIVTHRMPRAKSMTRWQ